MCGEHVVGLAWRLAALGLGTRLRMIGRENPLLE
jgi:hypothetical protein